MGLTKIYKIYDYIKSFFSTSKTKKDEENKVLESINIDIPKIKQLKK